MSSVTGSLKGGKGGSGVEAQKMAANIANSTLEKINNQNRSDIAPWYGAGAASVDKLRDLLGIGGPRSKKEIEMSIRPSLYVDGNGDGWGGYVEADVQKAVDEEYQRELEKAQAPKGADYGSLLKTFTMDDFYKDPSYDFVLGEGQKALERRLNAQGKTYSPEAVKALTRYNQDYAGTKFNEAYDRFNLDQNNIFNKLATVSGFGQNASNQLLSSNTNYGNAVAGNQIGIGNAQAAAQQARQVNNSSMFNTLLSAGAQLGSSYLLSDVSLKQNIIPMGKENGYPIYEFSYKKFPEKRFIGVMAQDVEKIKPEAVVNIDGYKAVDYDMIGVKMREVTNDD